MEHTTLDVRYPVRNSHFPQTFTIIKCIVTNICYTIRQFCLFQLCAVVKRIASNTRYALRNADLRQLIAGVESISSNACHPGFEYGFTDVGPVLVPGRCICTAKIGYVSITRNNQGSVRRQHPSQRQPTLPQRNAGQHRQDFILHRGFGLACFVLIDLPAAFTCVVGIVAGGPVSRLHRLGLFHGVAQGRNGHRFQGRLELGSLVPVELVAEVAGVVNSVTGLRTGGVLGLDLDKLMLFQGRQGFILYRGLLFAFFVLENLVAGSAGVVGIVAVFGVGRGLGLGFHHGMAQRGKGHFLQGGLLCAGIIFEKLTADAADEILDVA